MTLFDPRDEKQRAMAIEKGFVPKGGCDFSLRIEQGSRVIYCMLPVSAGEDDDPLKVSSLKTRAINVDSQYGRIRKVQLLYTPDAELKAWAESPRVLHQWR